MQRRTCRQLYQQPVNGADKLGRSAFVYGKQGGGRRHRLDDYVFEKVCRTNQRICQYYNRNSVGGCSRREDFNLLDKESEPEDAPDATALVDAVGDVEFKNVEFGYLEGAPVLKNLSFRAEHGQTVAIVGPTGAGKTTLVNLLMRFYDAWGGEILIDGKAVSSYTRDSLRGAFTMVLQDTWLFDGTVFENIAYGRPGATLDDVRRVARAANVADYIESLPDGYCSTVEDGGFNLSKGQKQLMTIARAMLSDAKCSYSTRLQAMWIHAPSLKSETPCSS